MSVHLMASCNHIKRSKSLCRSKWAHALVVILTGLCIIPDQFSLMVRLYQVQAEAARIVAFVYETERTTGQFPGTLSKYTYDNPEMTEFIQSYQCGQ